MPEYISLNKSKVLLQFNKSKRAKNLRLTIKKNGTVLLTHPWYVPKLVAKQFLKKNLNWLTKNHKKLSRHPKTTSHTKQQITELKIKARQLVRARLLHFNQHYHFHYSRITIRDQKTRWGSCSASGTLSFNYRLALLPPQLSDYVIVHELCHTKELNHSSKFWALVAQTIPNHKTLRKKLKSTNLGI